MNITATTDSVPVLLVDDRPENLISLEALLSVQGYDLIKATSGNEALRMTLKQDFALVLLDVQMPDMDGFETAELMRSNPKTCHIPIIFVTAGMKDLQFQFRGYDSGAVDYLAKPIEPAFLQSKVRVFAELYRQRREIELHKEQLEELVELRTAELQQTAKELEISNRILQQRNLEMEAVHEILRSQIVEFGETHDQLLATEEMLRIQLEVYESNQRLLNASNRNLQTLFDVTPLAIVVSSFPDGIIRDVNNTFSDDFGYANDMVIGKTGIDIGLWVDNIDRDLFLKLMHEQKEISGFSTEIRTFNGENRSVLLYSNQMDFNGENCLLIVFMDVTEQKKLEDQIRQTHKMDVIGQLAGGVAHDFNNMLTAIIGSAEMLESHVTNNAAAIKLLGSIRQAAGRSADLTGQLLAFSRKEHKNKVQVNINTAIREVISLLERTIDKSISLEARLVANNAYVVGDPTLLQNALLNLGVNARDAMPDGGVIKFSTSNVELNSGYCAASSFNITPGSYIEISVSDAGTGMTKEIIQHIFEPFFTTKEIGKGTGLGLAAVYNTVTDHNGSISIFSDPGIGTVFKLYLPLSCDKKTEITSSEALTQGSGGILLVDDEEILRDVGQALLEDLGYQVYLAEDGEQALKVYAQEKDHISLVILDMLMPNMGGKETLMRLMESYPETRVLISSGFHQEGTVDELVKLGARGFLHKPYSIRDLSKAVVKTITS